MTFKSGALSHILTSNRYVVDLDLLREKGYADSLRTVYHGMSADPNSLANLDQDLPNYLQYEWHGKP